MKSIRIFSAIIGLLLIANCDQPLVNKSQIEGTAVIYVEKNLQPYLETTLMAYKGYAPKENFDAGYEKEIDVINHFLSDKANLVFMSRELDAAELKQFKKMKYTIVTNKIILGSIALISPMGEDSTYTETEIMNLLTTNDENAPKMLFDDVQSSNFNYFMNKLEKSGKKFGKNVKCLHGNTQVIDYMKTNRNCIGIIGFNWISDIDDSEQMKSMENVQLLRISNGNSKKYTLPTMYYVYHKEYPFTHYWYMHLHGSRKGLEAGLSNYILSERGQLIAKKSGLQPYYKIAREFRIIEE